MSPGSEVGSVALVVAASVLAIAGAAKAIRPEDTARALRHAGLPVGVAAVRAGAALEVVLGVGCLAAGGMWSLLVAVSYAAFAAFVATAIARGWALASCGCFGEPDTPPTITHVVVTVALAASAAGGGLRAPLRPLMGSSTAAVALALAAVITGLVVLVLTALPRVAAEVRGMGPPSDTGRVGR